MKNEMNIWVIGGDMRQVKLAEALAGDGHTVHSFALEQAGEAAGVDPASDLSAAALADCVVLPLPVEGEGGALNAPFSEGTHPLEEVFAALRPGQVLCGGKVSQRAAALAAARGLTLHDYFAREELAVANAVPGALAVEHTKSARQERTPSPASVGKCSHFDLRPPCGGRLSKPEPVKPS